MTAIEKLEREKKRKEFLDIGIIVCEKCWGKGYFRVGLKAIEDCDNCDGTGEVK